MKVIALTGNTNVGKSTTLNIVYQYLLLFGYTQVAGHFRELGDSKNKDFIDIVEKKGKKVGIATMGDYGSGSGDSVQNLLIDLAAQGCDVAICACNNNLPAAISHINTYPHHIFINKIVASSLAQQRIENGADAELIYKQV